jgi:hypothetical protein
MMECVASILQRKWFARRWIAQEIALPKESPFLIAGRHVVPFDYLVTVVMAFLWKENDKPRAREPGFWEKKLLPMFIALRGYGLMRIWYRSQQKAPQLKTDVAAAAYLVRALAILALSKATYPQDALYGVISLTHPAQFPKSLFPNYDLPLKKIYHDYAVFLLARTGSLALLDCRRRELPDSPSWVPDFRYLGQAIADVDPSIKSSYFSFSNCEKFMKVRANKLSECTYVYNPPSVPGLRLNTAEEGFAEFTSQASRRSERSLTDVLDDLAVVQKRFDTWEAAGAADGLHYIVDNIDKIPEVDLYSRVMEQVQRYREQPRISHFLTSDGAIGLAVRPDVRLQPGDLVCEILGVWPQGDESYQPIFLLRQSGKGYELLGNCIIVVHGARGMEYWQGGGFSDGVREYVIE